MSRTEMFHEPNVNNRQFSKREPFRPVPGSISKALCDVFLRLSKVVEFQSTCLPVECPYSMSLARPGFMSIHKLFPFLSLSFSCPVACFPICILDGMEKAFSQITCPPFPCPCPFSFLCFPFLPCPFLSLPFTFCKGFPFQYASLDCLE